MNDLIAEARRSATVLQCSVHLSSSSAAHLIRRLADALERSVAENERLRVERGRLAQGMTWMCLRYGNDLDTDQAIDRTMCTLKIECAVDSTLAAALAAHDREADRA